jgi:hypothetical protein
MNSKAASKIEITEGTSSTDQQALIVGSHTKHNSIINATKRNNAKQTY